MTATSQALVLGGGGVAGVAWMTGLLAGLAEAGQDVTVPPAERLAVIASRLPSTQWPSRSIRLVAVDCESGQPRVFDGQSGVSLIDAVAASCAVPGIWPPVMIDGRRYMDGGVRSSDNADLASGAARIVVVSPFGLNSQVPSPLPLHKVVDQLTDGGAEVTVISPDEASAAAIGANPLDPATRRPAAEAGRTQGRAGLAAS